MSHGMFDRQGTFIRVQNRKGHVKTLGGHLSTVFVGRRDGNVVVRSADGRNQTRDGAFDNMLAHPSLQISTLPFDLHVDHPIQHLVDLFHHHGELFCM